MCKMLQFCQHWLQVQENGLLRKIGMVDEMLRMEMYESQDLSKYRDVAYLGSHSSRECV